MNRPEAEQIATAIAIIRPAWLRTSLTTMLGNLPPHHRNKPARDIHLALLWLAYDPTQATPRLLREDGPWWNLATLTSPSTTPRTVDQPNGLPTCPHGHYRTTCQPCTDHYRQTATRGAAKARQALNGHRTRQDGAGRPNTPEPVPIPTSEREPVRIEPVASQEECVEPPY